MKLGSLRYPLNPKHHDLRRVQRVWRDLNSAHLVRNSVPVTLEITLSLSVCRGLASWSRLNHHAIRNRKEEEKR